jgi:2-amino-4-hydroxy-6-hydroxymethyldihydropteridine diphosphokinase
MMKGIYLLLGSNQGDRMGFLNSAIHAIIDEVGSVLHSSSVYCTAAWGYTDQRDFYNRIVEVQSELSPEDLLKEIEKIMEKLGRVRNLKWRQRVIDIDILYYGNMIIEKPGLIIPHPRIQERRFTLIPLCELVPEFVHPVLGVSHLTLLEGCEDELEVMKL